MLCSGTLRGVMGIDQPKSGSNLLNLLTVVRDQNVHLRSRAPTQRAHTQYHETVAAFVYTMHTSRSQRASRSKARAHVARATHCICSPWGHVQYTVNSQQEFVRDTITSMHGRLVRGTNGLQYGVCSYTFECTCTESHTGMRTHAYVPCHDTSELSRPA